MRHALIAAAQERLNEARRELSAAANNFDVSDEKLLELRASARQAFEELKALDRKYLNRGLLSFLKFW
jgi:hypothetical protein